MHASHVQEWSGDPAVTGMAKGMHRDIGAMDSANAVIVKFPCMNMMESSSSLNQSSGRQLPYIMRKANIVSNTRRTTSNRELGRKLLRYIHACRAM